MIHRDIKPANIIVGKHGETLVVDWGLAKAIGRADPSGGEQTHRPVLIWLIRDPARQCAGHAGLHEPGAGAGRPEPAGPAVRRLQPGRHPLLPADRKAAVRERGHRGHLRAVQEGQFRRPSQHDSALDKALEAICLKAMATEPEKRYATPRALADDLDRWMADEPVSAWREPLARRARRWARRNRTAVTAAGAAVLVALVGTAAVLAVQTQANANLHAANTELAVANAKVTRANTELAASIEREQARFELAQEAIRIFHTGVSEDLLLKQKEFGALRTKLLRGAQDFYRKLEGMLGGQADRDSRLALGAPTSRWASSRRNSTRRRMHWRCTSVPWPCSKSWRARHRPTRSCRARSNGATPPSHSCSRRSGKRPTPWLPSAAPCAIAQDLAASDPADFGRRRELARVDHLHGAFLFDNSRVGEGLDALERARASQEDLVRSSPDGRALPARARQDMRRPGHAPRLRRAEPMRRWRSTAGRATWSRGWSGRTRPMPGSPMKCPGLSATWRLRWNPPAVRTRRSPPTTGRVSCSE